MKSFVFIFECLFNMYSFKNIFTFNYMEVYVSAFVHVHAILQQQTVTADPLELELVTNS